LAAAPDAVERTARALDDVGPAVEARPGGHGVATRIDSDLRLQRGGCRIRERRGLLQLPPATCGRSECPPDESAGGLLHEPAAVRVAARMTELEPSELCQTTTPLPYASRATSGRSTRGPSPKRLAVLPRLRSRAQCGLDDHVRSVRGRPDGQRLSGSVERDLRSVGVMAGSGEVVRGAPGAAGRAGGGLTTADAAPSSTSWRR
jgi:hypothetical protein